MLREYLKLGGEEVIEKWKKMHKGSFIIYTLYQILLG
jgi:hypothetical protein